MTLVISLSTLLNEYDFMQMVSDSPVSPLATFAPLLFVVAVTGIKQGYEDFLRHKNDSEVNVQLLQVVRNGKLQVT